MEIFTLLETLEDILENSKNLPFTNKGMVDKEEMLEIIKEIRIKLPDELKQAKWVKEERQRIMSDAESQAENLMKEAENKNRLTVNKNITCRLDKRQVILSYGR